MTTGSSKAADINISPRFSKDITMMGVCGARLGFGEATGGYGSRRRVYAKRGVVTHSVPIQDGWQETGRIQTKVNQSIFVSDCKLLILVVPLQTDNGDCKMGSLGLIRGHWG